MDRMFLTLVGAAYILLAAWCSLLPAKTSDAVGFTLQPGSGQSEYFTVYGGLQFALGIAFLLPLIRPGKTGGILTLCVLIHASLVVFRAISFVLYKGIPRTTYTLAATEWIIFIGAALLWWRGR